MDDAIVHFGGLDIVCSNSGVVSFGHLKDVTEVCIFFPFARNWCESICRDIEKGWSEI